LDTLNVCGLERSLDLRHFSFDGLYSLRHADQDISDSLHELANRRFDGIVDAFFDSIMNVISSILFQHDVHLFLQSFYSRNSV
jgi:hypothetical protein